MQEVTDLEILLDVPKLTGNCKCSLELCLKESSTAHIQQTYPVWVYDEDECASEILIPENEGYAVFEKNGKTVFVTQSEEVMDKLLKEHPLYRYFPTEDHANWQWWQLTNAYAFEIPDETEPFYTVFFLI